MRYDASLALSISTVSTNVVPNSAAFATIPVPPHAERPSHPVSEAEAVGGGGHPGGFGVDCEEEGKEGLVADAPA